MVYDELVFIQGKLYQVSCNEAEPDEEPSILEDGLILVNDRVEGEVVRAIKCKHCNFTTLHMSQLLLHHQLHLSQHNQESREEKERESLIQEEEETWVEEEAFEQEETEIRISEKLRLDLDEEFVEDEERAEEDLVEEEEIGEDVEELIQEEEEVGEYQMELQLNGVMEDDDAEEMDEEEEVETGPEGECVLYVCGCCGQKMSSFQHCRQHMLLQRHCVERDSVNAEEDDDFSDGPQSPDEPPSPSVQKGDLEYWMEPRTAREVRSKLCADRNLRCPEKKCSYRFSCQSHLQQHLSCHSSSPAVAVSTAQTGQQPAPFICLVCSAPFSGWAGCSLHLWRVHGRWLDVLRCPLCPDVGGHATHSAAGMARHLATHTAHCRTCDPPPPLAQGERWYARKKCQICQKMYANSKSLKKHIQAVHHKLKPFKCNVCGHSSATKNMLLLHQRQHTGEKPYLCEFCPYRSGDLNTRNKHRMRHTGEFPYRCPHCTYRCIQSGALRSHLRQHHPHLPPPPCARHPGVSAKASEIS